MDARAAGESRLRLKSHLNETERDLGQARASLDEIKQVSPATATDLTTTLSELKGVPPYSQSHQASFETVAVKDRSLVWTDSSIPFPVGRGQLIQNV